MGTQGLPDPALEDREPQQPLLSVSDPGESFPGGPLARWKAGTLAVGDPSCLLGGQEDTHFPGAHAFPEPPFPQP